MLLALLLVLLAHASARTACPESCHCSQLADGRDELDCDLPSGRVLAQGTMHESIEITCLEGHINCSELPQYPFSRNGSLYLLTVSECELHGPLACWLGAFGVHSVERVAFKEVKSELKAEHVKGLVGVLSLGMHYSYVQSTIPSEALAALPELKEFRLREAKLPAPQPLNNLNLTYLELSSDNIEQLADGAFQLGKLQSLHIWGNNIENITENTFTGLTSLKLLEISHNKIRVLPARVFSQMPLLTTLDLEVNAIEEVNSDAFYGLSMLQKIDAFDNRAPMRFSPRSLANLPSLQYILLRNCQIPSLPADLLVNSTQLINITITENAIEVLPDELFRSQELVRMLDLRKNKIRKLSYNTFWPLGSLVELNLDGNLIEELPDDLFNGVTNLRILHMNNNRLRFIADSALSHASSLSNVYMANNLLTFLPDDDDGAAKSSNDTSYEYREQLLPQSPLRRLYKSIEYLDLSGNRISRIFEDWRLLFMHIRMLNLSGNVIRDLNNADMQFLANYDDTTFDLRHNQIATVDLSTLGFAPEELNTETLYSTILLDNNPFICNCESQNFMLRLHNRFPYYNAMPKLDVGNARCVTPPHLEGELVKNLDPSILTCPLKREDCPESCSCDMRPSTKHLELTCSSLPGLLPSPIYYGMVGTELKLMSIPNSLDLPSHVDKLIFNHLHLEELPSIPPFVHHVDLSNNELTEIPVQLLRRNMTVLLTGNPFLCDCDHKEDVQMLKNNKGKVLDHSTVRCQDNQSTWQIDVPRLCSVRQAAILGGSLATLSIILIILAGLYYRYSTEIKIYLYSCEKLRWLITEEDIDRDKKYDAFISFSHKDEKFVAEKLIPVLESGSRPFKLCVHYRDWVVGEFIPAQIVTSVEESRRTIIVLSKDFVESVWGTMEFRIAHKRAQEEKRTRLVVILLEDAPPAGDLDAELRAYLSTNTYVKWGDPWFWEKLRYALAGGRVGSIGKTVKVEKKPKGGLNARLNSNGQIVNDTKDTLSTELSIG